MVATTTAPTRLPTRSGTEREGRERVCFLLNRVFFCVSRRKKQTSLSLCVSLSAETNDPKPCVVDLQPGTHACHSQHTRAHASPASLFESTMGAHATVVRSFAPPSLAAQSTALLICGAGVYASYLTQGVVQEALATKRFGPNAARFNGLDALHGLQAVACALWALVLIAAGAAGGKEARREWPPLRAYWQAGLSNAAGPTLGYLALKNISYAAQVRELVGGGWRVGCGRSCVFDPPPFSHPLPTHRSSPNPAK